MPSSPGRDEQNPSQAPTSDRVGSSHKAAAVPRPAPEVPELTRKTLSDRGVRFLRARVHAACSAADFLDRTGHVRLAKSHLHLALDAPASPRATEWYTLPG